jgi:iron complex transport system substrate-binding protein
MRLLRLGAVPAMLGLLALSLTACGTSEEPVEQTASTGTATSGPVSVTDARGQTVTLDRPATDVVGLEWGVVENLVTLGVMPVGVADVKGYTSWVKASPLDADVVDVGTRGEPSVDAVVALDPDLVVTTTDLPPNVIEQLEKAVPVLVVRGADASRPIEQMKTNVRLVAQAVDRTQKADELIADFDAAVTAGKKAIADAGAEGRSFAMADGWQQGSTVSIRMFTDGSLVGAVGESLGLTNAWPAEGDPDYGLAQTDVEGLTKLGELEFLYYANDADGGDPFAAGLADNPIWSSLPFVKANHVHRLPDGIWMFGGPASCEQFIDAFVQAVTA